MPTAANSSPVITQLPHQWQRLIRLIQDVNFGRVSFRVVRGKPDPHQPWRVLRTVKLGGGENGPRPEAGSTDFQLRREHHALLEQLSGLRDGAGVTVDVKHGLPFLMEIVQDHQVA